MQFGIVVPQGWLGEYAGWDPAQAWARSLAIAARAEGVGAESLWVFDHFQTTPEPIDALTFESFTMLGGLTAATTAVRLGHLVSCASYRNPALAAKMAATLDAMSGGRFDYGLGAGWKQDEFEAYGFGFPSLRERQERLEDALRIAIAMFGEGRATVDAAHTVVKNAFAMPKPVRPEGIPLMVGGNGRRVTWALAAQYADELNVDAMPAAEIIEARPDLEARCREAGRDPSTLRVSVHLWHEHLPSAGPARGEHLRAYVDAGVSRVMTILPRSVSDLDELDRFADDALAAGCEPGPGSAVLVGASEPGPAVRTGGQLENTPP